MVEAELAGIGKKNILDIFNQRQLEEPDTDRLSRYDNAKRWMDFGLEDLESSKILLDNKKHRNSLYLLQQSVEKLVKAYCIAFQILSEKEIRDVSHKTPTAFVKMLKKRWPRDLLDLMGNYNKDQLSKDIAALENAINSKDYKFAKLKENILDQILTSLENPNKNNVFKDAKKRLIDMMLNNEITRNINISEDAFTNLYVIALITYEYNKLRYPDEELTQDIGNYEKCAVIKQIDRIYRLLYLVSNQLKEILQALMRATLPESIREQKA